MENIQGEVESLSSAYHLGRPDVLLAIFSGGEARLGQYADMERKCKSVFCLILQTRKYAQICSLFKQWTSPWLKFLQFGRKSMLTNCCKFTPSPQRPHNTTTHL